MMEIRTIKLHIIRQILFIAVLFAFGDICFAAAVERTPNIDKKTVKGMIKKAVPMIEEITGRDFKKKVKFKLVERKIIRETIASSTTPLYKKLMKGENDDAIERQIENIVVSNSQSMLGLYDPTKRKFFVIPENVEYMIKMLGIAEKDFDDFVFLIVTHELVHALDDQYFDLNGKIESLEDVEAVLSFAALREGHAVYVTDKIAERLNLSATAEEMSVKSAAGIIGGENRAQMQLFHNIYVRGAEFVKKIVEKKGVIGISEAFASPPMYTSQIMDPVEYLSPSIITGLNCTMMIENIKPALPIEGMQTQSISLGATTLSALLISQGIGEGDAHAIARDCVSGALFVATRQTLKPKILMVMVLDFKSREIAEKFLGISMKTDKSSEAQFNAKLNSTYKVVKEAAMELKGFDTTRYRHVEKASNGVVTTEVSAEGLVENVYLAAAFVNMQEKIAEEDVSEIISALCQERMKML